MKTAQDSYTITCTIKQIVRFQERMHLGKFQVDNFFFLGGGHKSRPCWFFFMELWFAIFLLINKHLLCAWAQFHLSVIGSLHFLMNKMYPI